MNDRGSTVASSVPSRKRSQNVDDPGFVISQGFDGLHARPQDLLDHRRRAIPQPDPGDAGSRSAEGQPKSAEVGILGDHDIVVVTRKTQDGGIVGLA